VKKNVVLKTRNVSSDY